jgi:4-diphosphocytidyl-2-C-methyl-D-erythritol kinase
LLQFLATLLSANYIWQPFQINPMVVFSNCKINLGLHITGKRADGYHNLATVFYPLPFYDILEAVKAPAFVFTTSGLPIPGNLDDNLCVKAYRLMQQEAPALPPVRLHLHKNLPMGAGLGAGSANAAHTLLLLNQKFELGVSKERLLQLALELGSDCPFFIHNQPCFATGRGEQLTPVELNLGNYCLVLVLPGIHVSTREAFAGIEPQQPVVSLAEQIKQPVAQWKEIIRNDFEATVFKLHPSLGQIKQRLYESGAVYAAMSGSGSTVFGLFRKDEFDPAIVGRFQENVQVVEGL